jgi:preprotein translocase subunit YajC
MKLMMKSFLLAVVLFNVFSSAGLAQTGAQTGMQAGAQSSDVSAPTVVAPAQPAAVATTTDAGAAPAMGTAATPQQPSMLATMAPIGIMLLVMYFLMIRPQQKRSKQQQEMIGGLKNGDEIVTSAGIIGTITGMSEKVVTLEISKNVQMKILKSQVNQVMKGTIPDLQA